MKKIIILLSAIALITFSCSSKDKETPTPTPPVIEEVIVDTPVIEEVDQEEIIIIKKYDQLLGDYALYVSKFLEADEVNDEEEMERLGGVLDRTVERMENTDGYMTDEQEERFDNLERKLEPKI